MLTNKATWGVALLLLVPMTVAGAEQSALKARHIASQPSAAQLLPNAGSSGGKHCATAQCSASCAVGCEVGCCEPACGAPCCRPSGLACVKQMFARLDASLNRLLPCRRCNPCGCDDGCCEAGKYYAVPLDSKDVSDILPPVPTPAIEDELEPPIDALTPPQNSSAFRGRLPESYRSYEAQAQSRRSWSNVVVGRPSPFYARKQASSDPTIANRATSRRTRTVAATSRREADDAPARFTAEESKP